MAKKKQPTSPGSIPPDWKQRLGQSISGYSRHPKEKDLMLRWLRDDFRRKNELDETAGIIWDASRKRRRKIEDPPDFFEHFEYVLLSLAISVTTPDPPLTAKAFQAVVDTLEKLREKPFFRKGEAGEELDREIKLSKIRAERASPTKPKTPGRLVALRLLLQYLRDDLEMKQPHLAVRLLIYIGHGVRWAPASSRTRAAEQAEWKDVSGLEKATVANTTKEAWAALDMLKGEEYEAALENMSPEMRDLYESSKNLNS
jgi:hypothetical protein